MFFELSRAGEVERGMAPEGIVEPVDVAANGPVGLLAGVEDGPPDELGFQGLEEPFPHGVVIAVPLARAYRTTQCNRSNYFDNNQQATLTLPSERCPRNR